MEFSVKKNDILRELSLTQGVVEKKATIPILANLLLEARKQQLDISATNLELGIRLRCQAKVTKEGASTVPAKRLWEIVRSLPDAEIKLKALENHWVQLTCERSTFKLVGMARDNFPTLPELPETSATLPAGVLAKTIDKTVYAISSEESRYTLNGALMILKPDAITMVATDGHRLAHLEHQISIQGLNHELRTLVPKKAMGELQRMLSEVEEDSPVEFFRDENHLFFRVGGRLLTSRMLTGQFPNYEAVLPSGNDKVLELDSALISAAVRRVALLADERSRAIRFRVEKGRLEVSSSSGDYGEARETLETSYKKEPLEIGFNFQYLLDFFGALSEGGSIALELKDEHSAGQFRPIGDHPYRYRYVVMPMRI